MVLIIPDKIPNSVVIPNETKKIIKRNNMQENRQDKGRTRSKNLASFSSSLSIKSVMV